jgi:toxin YoeB
MYEIKYTSAAEEDIEKLKKTGDKRLLKKLSILLKELMEHPSKGVGKPELLKGSLSGCYSRGISQKHRLVYQIFDKNVVVLILSAASHYGDK